MTRLSVQQIGAFAREAVSHGSHAVVVGVTSQGAFVQVDDRRITFISSESYSGPLTLNLPGLPRDLDAGARAGIEKGVFCFRDENLCIDTTPAALWKPPARPGSALLPAERSSLLAQVAHRFWASRQPTTGFSALLADLLDLPATEPELSKVPLAAFRRLRAEWAIASRRAAFPPAFSAALLAFLGLGGGLTPSGDDLVAGLLLALNRWGELLAPGFPVQRLNEAVMAAAPTATSALSAALLECAAAGQASQHLVEALDELVTGQPGPEAVLANLQAYGASSGLDTLLGFALAIG